MEYQKILNLLDNTSNQPSKFGIKIGIKVEINDGSRGTYNTNTQIKFETSVLKSSLCDCGDSFILVKGTITITGKPANATGANKLVDRRNMGVIFKSCAPFTGIGEINNTQIDNT